MLLVASEGTKNLLESRKSISGDMADVKTVRRQDKV